MYTIGDFLIQLKNSYMAHKKEVVYPHSKMVLSLSKILTDEGYLKKTQISEVDGRKMISIELLYKNKRPAMRDVKLVSKPSLHRYVSKIHVRRLSSNFGISVVSTSQGVMTGKNALKKGVGGELLCEIS